jgi:hypothetical protein
LALPFAAAAVVGSTAQAQDPDITWFVDAQEGDDNNNGRPTWNDAFQTLQRALEAAATDPLATDLIKVAQGLYIPSSETAPPIREA